MKTAIYVEDGIVQLVMTPENEFEQNALASFRDKPMDAKLFSGSFYDCRGGWVRQTAHGWSNTPGTIGYERNDDTSLILVARTVQPEPQSSESLSTKGESK